MATAILFLAARGFDFEDNILLVLLGCGAVFLVMGIVYFSRRRSQTMGPFAGQHGFYYEKSGNPGVPETLLVIQGGSPKLGRARPSCVNILRGVWRGYGTVIFDLETLRQQRPNLAPRTESLKTVIAFYSPEARLPAFQLEPQKSDNITHALPGVLPVPFASHAELSKQYRLSGEDTKEVTQVFQPAVLEYLSSPAFDRHIGVQASGDWLLFHKKDKSTATGAVKPEDLGLFLHQAAALADMVFARGSGGTSFAASEISAKPAPSERPARKGFEERLRSLVHTGQAGDAVDLACSEGRMSLSDAQSFVRRLMNES